MSLLLLLFIGGGDGFLRKNRSNGTVENKIYPVDMSVGKRSRPCAGDAEAKELAAAGLLEEPSSPRSPLPERWAGGGSRLWALAGESSDEESGADRSEGRATAGCRSPRSGPSRLSLGRLGAAARSLPPAAMVLVCVGRSVQGAPDRRRFRSPRRWCRQWRKISRRWCRRIRRWL
jgi:hypothetical protein